MAALYSSGKTLALPVGGACSDGWAKRLQDTESDNTAKTANLPDATLFLIQSSKPEETYTNPIGRDVCDVGE